MDVTNYFLRVNFATESTAYTTGVYVIALFWSSRFCHIQFPAECLGYFGIHSALRTMDSMAKFYFRFLRAWNHSRGISSPSYDQGYIGALLVALSSPRVVWVFKSKSRCGRATIVLKE